MGVDGKQVRSSHCVCAGNSFKRGSSPIVRCMIKCPPGNLRTSSRRNWTSQPAIWAPCENDQSRSLPERSAETRCYYKCALVAYQNAYRSGLAARTAAPLYEHGSASATLDVLMDDIGNIVTIPRDKQDTEYDKGSDSQIAADRGLLRSRRILQNRSGES